MDIKFPKFLPPWLIICSTAGIVFAFLGRYLALGTEKVNSSTAIGFGLGFCLGVLGLVGAYLSEGKFEGSSVALPPIWVTVPITVAVVVYIAVCSVHEQRIEFLKTGTLIEGDGAVILGKWIILAAGIVSGLMILRRGVGSYIAAALGICISLAGLVFAVRGIGNPLPYSTP